MLLNLRKLFPILFFRFLASYFTMSLEFRTLQPEEFYRQHIEAGVRPDGRKLEERRAMAVSAGNITTVRV